jgi:S-adenosylmethionine decarboxylase
VGRKLPACYSLGMAVIGRHVVVDVWGADPARLDDKKEVLATLQSACEEAGATVLHSWYHSFHPQGVTALVGLAESHASIHTYPELGFYSADMFTCGDLDPRRAMARLVCKLGGRGQGWFMERGSRSEPVEFSVNKPEPPRRSSDD